MICIIKYVIWFSDVGRARASQRKFWT